MTTAPHTTFAALYADISTDPHGANHSSVFAEHSATGTVTPAELRAKVFAQSAEQVPQTFLATFQPNGSTVPLVFLLHNPFKVTPLIGMEGATLEIVMVGDLRDGNHPQVVHLDANAFHRTNNVRVDELGTYETHFAAAPGPNAPPAADFQQPVDPNAAQNSEEVQVRKIAYIPPQLAALLMSRQTYTIRQTWQIVGSKIMTDTASDATLRTAYKPLLDWLRVTATLTATGTTATALDTMNVVFPSTPEVERRTKAILRRDLPALYEPRPPAGAPDLRPAISTLTAEITRGNTEAAARATKGTVKTPEQYYGEILEDIYRYTGTTNVDELPPIYGAMAGTPKNQQRSIFERHVNQKAADLNRPAPVTTVTIYTRCTGLQFGMTDPDALDTQGLHTYLTCVRDRQNLNKILAEAQTYDYLQEGNGASKEEITLLKKLEEIRLPLTALEARHSVEDFGVILHLMLGKEHDVVHEWDMLLDDWIMHERQVAAIIETNVEGPAQALRWLQIRLNKWFVQQVRQRRRVRAPRFNDLIDKITMHENWNTPLPPKYQAMLPTLRGRGSPPTGHPTPLTPAAPQPPAGGGGNPVPRGERGERVNNPNPDPELQEFRDSGVSIKTARERAKARDVPVPNNTNGAEMCLSYQIGGACWSNCGRCADHVTHNAADKEKLKTYCRIAFTQA